MEKENKTLEQEIVEELCEDVEFLHGMPVSLPQERKDKIRHALTRVREEEREKIIKYMRSGKIAGSFSEGCDCEKCNEYEKKVRKDLQTLNNKE